MEGKNGEEGLGQSLMSIRAYVYAGRIKGGTTGVLKSGKESRELKS